MVDISYNNVTTYINTTTILPSNDYISDITFYGYCSLFIVIFGTLFNVLGFAVLCRRTFRDTKTRPVTHYMRLIMVMDLLSVYGWNLDNYLQIIHGFTLAYSYTIASCKFSIFFNTVLMQASAWIRVFICLDRYLALSRMQPNTWFNRSRNILTIIAGTIVFFILFNLHFLIFVCYRDTSGQIVIDSTLFRVYPTYSRVNMAIGICLPFLLMMSFNSISIYHLIQLRNTTLVQNSRIRHRSISITLIITAFLFLVTSVPSKMIYSFFFDQLGGSIWGQRILNTFDTIGYIYPLLDFPIYLATFSEFRHELFNFVARKREVHSTAQTNRQLHVT
ncbi:unnamed protein product [Adineta ricciae]|uniref:G-protein coupled receptors family 1 profile domain-containing protein n=1 Tax=Adineta ricciae TaxID=249248 RepID=A0A815ES25_ADIRI|nr:unnamed protein product [Adineta ricciae]CAF1315329.1 unnamed protein product [Adineta ricciae]